MKKILVLVLMAFVVNAAALAQTYQEVVYLKNGSVIRGVIVEQIPSVSLKIQTADGSIFAYQMEEVEKITKEPVVSSTKTKTRTTYADNGYKLKKGYRGFVDVGYSVGVGKWGKDRVGASTSHGYQIIPSLYTGLGFGVHYGLSSSKRYNGPLQIPVFFDVRGTLPCRSICQPFLDFKIGYTVYRYNGLYLNPSIGCRFAINGVNGICVGVGYSRQKISYKKEGAGMKYDGAINFKVGFDF